MRKNFLWIFLVVLLVAGGGSYVLWMTQANHARQNIEHFISEFNSGPVKITYDHIATSGFPSRLVVDIVNPKLSGRMDLLLDPNKQRMLPEWDEEAALQGVMQFSIDAISNHTTLLMDGSWKNTSILNGQSVSLASKSDFHSQCSMQLDRTGGWAASLWNLPSFQSGERPLWKDFRLLDCVFGDLALIDAASGVTLFQNATQRMYISNEPQDSLQKIRFYLKGADSFVTPDGDRVFAVYSRAFSPAALPPMLSAYGKQTIEIDLTYEGPLEWQADPKTAPVNLQLSTFLVHNDAYDMNASLSVSNAADAQNQSARLAFKTKTTYNQIFGALSHDIVRNVIAQLFADQTLSANLPPSHTPESVYALIEPAIPDFHQMGTFTAALDLGFKGNPGFTSGDFTLADLELSATPYGITGKGSGKRAPGALMPALNVTLVCRNCLQMVDDLSGYANRLSGISATLNPEKPISAFTPATIDGYKNFLRTLAGDDGAGNFTFVVMNDGKSGFTINHKRTDEVLMLYHQYVPQPAR